MPYMLLIVEPRGQREARTEAEGHAAYGAMLDWAGGLQSQGLLLGCDALRHDRHGVRVQVRDGAARTLDGPFAETKEMVGGYFMLDAKSRDEAVALATRCPAAKWATVEVREVGPCWD